MRSFRERENPVRFRIGAFMRMIQRVNTGFYEQRGKTFNRDEWSESWDTNYLESLNWIGRFDLSRSWSSDIVYTRAPSKL